MLKVSHRKLKELLTQSAEVGYDYDIKRLPFAQAVPFSQNTTLQHTVAAAVKLAQDDLTNIVQTLGFVGPDGNFSPLTDAFKKACDFAFTQTATGAADYTTAIRQACKNLADQGIQTIDYESGVHTSLEAAVRRNVMGGLGLMQEQIAQQNHDDLGCDGWEISVHANSAPDHEPIQGRQYSDAEYKALNNSLVRRIGTLNCGHDVFPIILGVSAPQYTPEELRKFREDNDEGIDYQGKHYTGYKASQRQRRMEDSMRLQKRRILTDEATGDTEKLQIDQIRLQMQRQNYARFSKAAGLRTQNERAQVAGFGRSQAARATAYAKEQAAMVAGFTAKMETAGYHIKGFENYVGDQQTLDEMSNAYTRLSGLYPNEANGLTISRSWSGDNNTLGWFDSKTRTIHFNRDVFKNWGALESEYADLVKSGYFPAGTDSRSCFYHEFGHAVDNYRGIRSHRKDIDAVLLDMGYGHVNSGQREIALWKELSGYAAEKTTPQYQEALAEAFSEWYNSNNPSEFCKKFLERSEIL